MQSAQAIDVVGRSAGGVWVGIFVGIFVIGLPISGNLGCAFDPPTVPGPPTPGEPAPGDGLILDAAPPLDSSPEVACTNQYGGAMDFQLCGSTPTSCTFYVVTNEDTCNNLCASFGGTCQESWDGDCGTTPGSQGCTPVHFNQVCVCSLE